MYIGKEQPLCAFLAVFGLEEPKYEQLEQNNGERTGDKRSINISDGLRAATNMREIWHANTAKVLFPNWGDYDVHEGFSETFSSACQDGTNCLTSDAFSLWPEYAYYPVLVALWQH